MPRFESAPKDHAEEASSHEQASVHQTPLYVVTFTGEHATHPDIITLPGGRLLRGRRNSVQSIERNAKQIAATHQLHTSADRRLHLPEDDAQGSLGYSVSRAHRTPLPPMADFRRTQIAEGHDLALELHDYDQLTEYLDTQPERQLELKYLRALGATAHAQQR